MLSNHTIIIGISGASASGKTLLANTIVSELGSDQVSVIPEDGYYKDLNHLSFEERAKTNYDHPDSLDHALLIKHLKQLQKGKTVEIPQHDFTLHQRKKETRTIGHHRIIVLEGILLFTNKERRYLMEISIFMDTPLDI